MILAQFVLVHHFFPSQPLLHLQLPGLLVVDWVVQVSKIKHHCTVRPCSARNRKLSLETDGAIEAQPNIRLNINVLCVEVRRRIDKLDVSSLRKVIRDDDVLLIGSDLDIMRADNRLVLIRIIEALDVVQIRDIEGGDVVGGSQRLVCKSAVFGQVGVDGHSVSSLRTEIVEEFDWHCW